VTEPAVSLAGVFPLDLPDVQAQPPAIPIVVDEAGIADLRYPLTIQLSDGTRHTTVASASIAASVPSDVRGVHMSRFVEVLHAWHTRLGVRALSEFLTDLTDRCGATAVVARFEFPLFLEREAPVSNSGAFVAYDCVIEGRMLQSRQISCTLTTRVPITSLCPCSREISDYGAHNQRGAIEVSITFALPVDPIDFADMIEATEEAGSAPIYSLLKRTDERYVTMQAYENPAFVEDIVRSVAAALKPDRRIVAGRIRAVNEESIHAHNAYAAISWSRASDS
jgi:GTP cyclohydrolase I